MLKVLRSSGSDGKSKLVKITGFFGSRMSGGMYYKPLEKLHAEVTKRIQRMGDFDDFRLYCFFDNFDGSCDFFDKKQFGELSKDPFDRSEFDEQSEKLKKLTKTNFQSTSNFGVLFVQNKRFIEFIDQNHILYLGELTLTLQNIKKKTRISKISFQQKQPKDTFQLPKDKLFIKCDNDKQYHAFYKLNPTPNAKHLTKINEFYLSEVLGRSCTSRDQIYLQKDSTNPNHHIFFTKIQDLNELSQDGSNRQEYYISILLDQNMNVMSHSAEKKERHFEGKPHFKNCYPLEGTNLVLNYVNRYNSPIKNVFRLIDLKACRVEDEVLVETRKHVNMAIQGLIDPKKFNSLDFDFEGICSVERDPDDCFNLFYLDGLESVETDLIHFQLGPKAKKLVVKKICLDFFPYDYIGKVKKFGLSSRFDGFENFFVARNKHEEKIELHFFSEEESEMRRRVVEIQDEELFGQIWDYHVRARMVGQDLMVISSFLKSHKSYLVDLRNLKLIPITSADSRLL